MEYNYSVREGELLQINSRKAKMVIRFAVLFRFLKMLLLLFSFGVTVYVTYLIFRECITDADRMYSAGVYFCHLRFGGDLGDLPLLQ